MIYTMVIIAMELKLDSKCMELMTFPCNGAVYCPRYNFEISHQPEQEKIFTIKSMEFFSMKRL